MEKLEKENITKKLKNENSNNRAKYSDIKPNDIEIKNDIKPEKSIFKKKDILIIFLSFLSFYFYIKSFKGCDGTQSYCLVTLSPSFFYLLGI